MMGVFIFLTMNSIGIRVSPKVIYYSIVYFSELTFSISNQELTIPVSFDTPQKLKYVRKTMLDIFNEYHIKLAGIRITEPVANPDNFRVMLEGTIQELIASSKVERYFAGATSSIASKLGIPNDGMVAELVKGDQVFQEISDWNTFSSMHKEAVLCAFAVNNL
jgi:hypothetical protein